MKYKPVFYIYNCDLGCCTKCCLTKFLRGVFSFLLSFNRTSVCGRPTSDSHPGSTLSGQTKRPSVAVCRIQLKSAYLVCVLLFVKQKRR